MLPRLLRRTNGKGSFLKSGIWNLQSAIPQRAASSEAASFFVSEGRRLSKGPQRLIPLCAFPLTGFAFLASSLNSFLIAGSSGYQMIITNEALPADDPAVVAVREAETRNGARAETPDHCPGCPTIGCS